MTKPLHIFGWAAGNDGCAYYRLVLPLAILQRDPDVTIDIGIKMPPEEFHSTDHDRRIIVAQRLMKPLVVEQARIFKAEGRKIVVEHDDDLSNIRSDNPAILSKSSNWPPSDEWRKSWLPAMHEAMGFASLVTCTNTYLATELRQYSDHVTVLPNYIDSALLKTDMPLRNDNEHLKVGWAGSPTHDKDWTQAAPFIQNGLGKVHMSELVLIGSDYQWLVGHKRTTVRPWETDLNKYFNNLTDIHIGLAPLADDHFNRSKSYIKALEYAALGIPVIANDVEPYRNFIQHGVTGFLVKYGHEWARYIRILANDEPLRRKMGEAAREVAAQNTIQKNAWRWLEAYEEIM